MPKKHLTSYMNAPQYDKRLFIEFPEKIQVQNMLYTKIVFLFWHSKQYLYTTCSELVFFGDFNEQSQVILWVNWFKNESFWHRFTCNTYEMEWECMKETGKYTHYYNKGKICNSFLCPIHGLNNANYCMSNDSLLIMAIRVVEFSSGGYKIRKIFA